MSGKKTTASFFSALLVFMGAMATADAQCRRTCMPDERLNSTTGCCEEIPEQTNQDGSVGCGPGKQRSAQTQGHCCYPNQVWGGGRCRGIPGKWDCPAGHEPDQVSETCRLKRCTGGRNRARDGVTCCLPGQVASGGTCRGRPSWCPAGHQLRGEECVEAEPEPEPRRPRRRVITAADRQEMEQYKHDELRDSYRSWLFNLRFGVFMGYYELELDGSPYCPIRLNHHAIAGNRPTCSPLIPPTPSDRAS